MSFALSTYELSGRTDHFLPTATIRDMFLTCLIVSGDHVAACPRSGTLRQRGGPLERAAARVCREAGAAVATNVLVRDLNLQAARQDERRIEVIANGLPLVGRLAARS